MSNATKYERIEKYDALVGRWIRDIRINDIVSISTTGQDTAAAAATLASTAMSANDELYITGIVVGAVDAGDGVSVTVGTSTIVSTIVPAQQTIHISGSRESPIGKVSASETVRLIADNAGTYTASLWGIKEPIFTKVETA